MANPSVTVEINGKDNLSPALKKVNVNLKEMGEKVSQLGMRMGAAFTLPIVGAALALNKFGAESAKAFDEAAGDLSKLSPEVIKAAEAYKQMQAALAPVNAEMQKTQATLLQALVPVIQQLAPLLIQAAQWVSNMAVQFAALPVPVQNFVVTGLAIVAATPLIITAVGQIISTIGILKDLFVVLPGLATGAATAIKGLGTVFGAVATGPVALLVAGIGALVLLFQSGWVDRAIDAFNQLGWIIAYAWSKALGMDPSRMALPGSSNLAGKKAGGGPVSGGSSYLVGERGPELFVPRSSGSIVPNHQLGGAGGGVTIVYSPVISTASQNDIERMGRLIEQAQRRRP